MEIEDALKWIHDHSGSIDFYGDKFGKHVRVRLIDKDNRERGWMYMVGGRSEKGTPMTRTECVIACVETMKAEAE